MFTKVYQCQAQSAETTPPHLKLTFFRFRVYFSKFLLDFKIYERKLLANINIPPSADSRKAVTLFDRGATWREAVAVITGHTDDKGSRQGERTATDSSSTALFIVQVRKRTHGA